MPKYRNVPVKELTLQERLERVHFVIIDTRTGKIACSGVWTEELANAMIDGFRERQKRGGRPDLSKEDCECLKAIPEEEYGT